MLDSLQLPVYVFVIVLTWSVWPKFLFLNTMQCITVLIQTCFTENTFTWELRFTCSAYKCMTFEGVPVFGPNIWEVRIAAFWAAIGRAALLFTEAACPPVARKRSRHWPSRSHRPMKQLTKSTIQYKCFTQKIKLLRVHIHNLSKCKLNCIVHVKAPGEQKETVQNSNKPVGS